uniref:Uncharacterized protein n=1 Tax=Mycena chlorophos TaxID=658473 RepID=A0ABQ0L2I9_MYCCL|nr:predicted protein [Mycena chlorophos]
MASSVDGTALVAGLRAHLARLDNNGLSLSPEQHQQLQAALAGLDATSTMQPLLPNATARHSPDVEYDVFIHSRLTLTKLIRHPPGTVLTYPETSSDPKRPVGHLLPVDLKAGPQYPWRDAAYSYGGKRGGDKERAMHVPVLLDHSGNMVPCYTRHVTCKSFLFCFFADF